MGYFDKYVKKSVPFMDGREKGNISQLSTIEEFFIDNWAKINTKFGETYVFTVQGIEPLYFFANSILTEVFDGVEEDGAQDILKNTGVSVEKTENAKGTATYWLWSFHEDTEVTA